MKKQILTFLQQNNTRFILILEKDNAGSGQFDLFSNAKDTIQGKQQVIELLKFNLENLENDNMNLISCD